MSKAVDFPTLERPTSPNTHLLAPEGLCLKASPDEPSPIFDRSPETLFKQLDQLVSGKKNWVIQDRNADTLQIELIAKTSVLKFKDDVSIRVLPIEGDAGKSKLAIYSRSRVGYHDLGANRKRVHALLEELKNWG